MMRRDPFKRITIQAIDSHPVVLRARQWMQRTYESAVAVNASVFPASALAGAPDGFLDEILARSPSLFDDDAAMDVSA